MGIMQPAHIYKHIMYEVLNYHYYFTTKACKMIYINNSVPLPSVKMFSRFKAVGNFK